MKKAILYPINLDTNSYISSLKNEISKDYQLLKYKSKFDFFYKIFFNKYDTVFLNWFESTAKSSITLKVMKFVLFYWRLRKIKIVWTYHNRVPHEKHNRKIGSEAIKVITNYSDTILAHSILAEDLLSNESLKKKLLYYPIPRYEFKTFDFSSNKSFKKNGNLNICIFGMIKKYKRIEEFLDIIKNYDLESINITIIGSAESNSIKRSIEQKVKILSNINVIFDFISEEDVPSTLTDFDFLLLTQGEDSCLSSAVLALGFSLGIPMIIPEYKTFSNYIVKPYIYSYKDFDDLPMIFNEINQLTENEINVLRQECYNEYKNITWSNFYDKIVDVLNNE